MTLGADDSRSTTGGRRLIEQVHGSANAQVHDALALLRPEQRARVLEGMSLYARALARARVLARVVIRPIADTDDPAVDRIIRTVMTEHGAVGSGFAILDPEVPHMSETYRPDARPAAAYFVLDDGGRVVGGAGFGALGGGSEGRGRHGAPRLRRLVRPPAGTASPCVPRCRGVRRGAIRTDLNTLAENWTGSQCWANLQP